jgi:uncharacterized protein YceK
MSPEVIKHMNQYISYGLLIATLLSGCGSLIIHDPAAPASHHAQRKYDEAVRKGTVVPAEKSKEGKKEEK